MAGLSIGIVHKPISDLENSLDLLIPAAVHLFTLCSRVTSLYFHLLTCLQVDPYCTERIRIIISHNVKYATSDDMLSTLRFVSAARLGFPVMVYVKGLKVSVDEDKEMGAAYAFNFIFLFPFLLDYPFSLERGVPRLLSTIKLFS
jgi:hypothetical protein